MSHTRRRLPGVLRGALGWTLGLALASCTKTTPNLRPSGDGLDIRALPAEYQGDYALFSQRCSKCHSLARALDNGHVDDKFWHLYVERMRRQPGSGIAPEDVPSILRFLHYYSTEIAAADVEGKDSK